MLKLWRLSPSDLTFLWDECKRCFYLKVTRQFDRPRAPFPKIFSRIDKLMQAYFEGKPASDLSAELPEGVVKFGEMWVESQPIKLPEHTSQCFIRGRFDTVVEFSDATYGVIDFKTTEPSPHHIPFYGRQLHAYAYSLEHSAPGKFSLSPVSRLGLLCVEPTSVDWADGGRIAYVGEVSWLECPKDEAGFLIFIDEVLTVLEQPDPPPSESECPYCLYRARARSGGW